MWKRNGNIMKYMMKYIFNNNNNIPEILLNYIQLLSINISNRFKYFKERFGIIENTNELYYNEFINFILTFYNNYPYKEEDKIDHIKNYILSNLYKKDYSFGDLSRIGI